MPRIPISTDQIERVVHQFYAQVRADKTLGPIFAAHVADWPSHEIKITDFWRNALRNERVYHGNPMQKHLAAGNVHAAHFEPWLLIFDSVLAEQLPADLANAWSELAHRIGKSLRFGLAQFGHQAATVPDLS